MDNQKAYKDQMDYENLTWEIEAVIQMRGFRVDIKSLKKLVNKCKPKEEVI